jgi:hypothetical protein
MQKLTIAFTLNVKTQTSRYLAEIIINIKTNAPVTPDVAVKLKVNGVETQGFRYDSTTASYTLKLPVGVSYDILPSVKNFYNKYEQVDLTKVKKGSKIAKNFYVTL